MPSTNQQRQSLLCADTSSSLLPAANQSTTQQQKVIEEIIGTGSFTHRSEGFQPASQITQFSADNLVVEGTLNIDEVIQNLPLFNGSDSAITDTIQGTDSRSTTIDLRGLGNRSTLTLVDGKRLKSQSINAPIPAIAIQRIDIVADCATALYGSEVATGVVNFVPCSSC